MYQTISFVFNHLIRFFSFSNVILTSLKTEKYSRKNETTSKVPAIYGVVLFSKSTDLCRHGNFDLVPCMLLE